ncbi:MAG: hypothetical protein ACE5G9_07350 [Nitrospinales bacterium]
MKKRLTRAGCLFLVLLSGLFAFAASAAAAESGFEKYRRTLHEQIDRQRDIIKQHPDDAAAYFKLGLALMGLGRHREEIEAYRQAIRLKADFAAAYANLSIAHDRLHDGRAAIRAALKARQLYGEKRVHRKIRAAQRQLRFLYDKYGLQPEDFEPPP